MGLFVRLMRRWATFRGERCLSSMPALSAPFRSGETLVVGNRLYVITRVLPVRLLSSHEAEWEIWGRRQAGSDRAA